MESTNVATFVPVSKRKDDLFQQIMFDSFARKEALQYIFKDIERLIRRPLLERDKERIANIVGWLEIEDGVTVFSIGKKPDDKVFVGKADLGCDDLLIYWGLNRKSASWDKYSLGVSIKSKPDSAHFEYTESQLNQSFPTVCKYILKCIEEDSQPHKYKLKVYSTAGNVYKDVKAKNGKWLVQTPSEKGQFVPNRGIGMYVPEENTFYVYEPKPLHKLNKTYTRTFSIVRE